MKEFVTEIVLQLLRENHLTRGPLRVDYKKRFSVKIRGPSSDVKL